MQYALCLNMPGLHNLWYPIIRDTSTWSIFGTWRTWRCFPVLQLRCALILRELNQTFIAYLFKGGQEQSFFLQTLLFTAFLVTVLKILTYALVSTWSSVSSGWEHVKRKMHPCTPDCTVSARKGGDGMCEAEEAGQRIVRGQLLDKLEMRFIGRISKVCDSMKCWSL